MQIGETINFVPMGSRGPKGEGLGRQLPARVVWIHPLGRFAVVERRTAFYHYREAIRLAPRRKKQHENDRNHEPEGWRWKNRHSAESR